MEHRLETLRQAIQPSNGSRYSEDLLIACAYLSEQCSIPLSALRAWAYSQAPEDVDLLLYEALDPLERYSLIEYHDDSISLPHGLQSFIRDQHQGRVPQSILERLMEALTEDYQETGNPELDEARKKALFPHLICLKNHTDHLFSEARSLPFANLLESIGFYYLYRLGNPQNALIVYTQAQNALKVYTKALTIKEAHYRSTEHVDLFSSLFNLGKIYQALKQTDLSDKSYRRAKEILDAHPGYGPEHPWRIAIVQVFPPPASIRPEVPATDTVSLRTSADLVAFGVFSPATRQEVQTMEQTEKSRCCSVM